MGEVDACVAAAGMGGIRETADPVHFAAFVTGIIYHFSAGFSLLFECSRSRAYHTAITRITRYDLSGIRLPEWRLRASNFGSKARQEIAMESGLR